MRVLESRRSQTHRHQGGLRGSAQPVAPEQDKERHNHNEIEEWFLKEEDQLVQCRRFGELEMAIVAICQRMGQNLTNEVHDADQCECTGDLRELVHLALVLEGYLRINLRYDLYFGYLKS